MKKYDRLSKTFYVQMHTEYLAYELYLDKTFHKSANNSVEILWNGCLDDWVLTDEEVQMIIENAKNIAKIRYNVIP